MQGNSSDSVRLRCSYCREEKPTDAFYLRRGKRRSRKFQAYCKDCDKLFAKTWHRCPAGRISRRWALLLHRHGITKLQYEAMLAAQDSVCAICRQPETRKDRSGHLLSLAVDHCHQTGKIRMLLCRACNQGIGFFKDDPALLRAALDYIERHS
jgi:Recombination endonuclease VII